MSKVVITLEDNRDDGGITVKIEEIDSINTDSKVLIAANHIWKYIISCTEEGIF